MAAWPDSMCANRSNSRGAGSRAGNFSHTRFIPVPQLASSRVRPRFARSVTGTPGRSRNPSSAPIGESVRSRSVQPTNVSANGEVEPSPVWEEWGRITRFLESARLAFARERNLWTSLEIKDAEEVKLSAANGHGTYRVSLAKHLTAVQDEDILLGSVLIHSYALAESAAAQRLRADARDFGGIEDWGARLLATRQSTWDSLRDGLAGAVEVAVVRNAYAHGTRRIGQSARHRLHLAGSTRSSNGDAVTLDYPTLKLFRGRIRNLMDIGGIDQGR